MKSQSWKLWMLALATLVLAAFAAACGGDDDDDDAAPVATTGGTQASPTAASVKKYDPGVTDTSILLGGSFPFTGNLAGSYATIGKTSAAYMKFINETQGGVNGRKIEFKQIDDGYDPSRMVQNARQLVEQDKIFAWFTSVGTPTNTAIHEYMNQQKVPQIFVATGAAKWGDPQGHPWTIGWLPDYISEGKVYAKYILKNTPNAKIAVLYQNDDYGKDYLKGMEQGLGDKAATMIVKKVTYESTDATVNAQVTTLKESGADTFYIAAVPKFSVQAIVQAKQLGWKPTIYLNGVSNSIPASLKLAQDQGGADSVSNVISTLYLKDPSDPAWKDDKAMKDYLEFVKKYNPEQNPNDSFTVYTYAVSQMMVEVLKRCKDELTRENLMKQAASIKDYRLDIFLPGILINTSATDFYPVQQLQLHKYNPTAAKWDSVGELIDSTK